MKPSSFLLLSVISFLISGRVFSQDNILELFEDTESFVLNVPDSSNSSLFLDAGCFLMPVNDLPVNGLSLRLGGTDKHSSSSFAFDFMHSDRIFFPTAPEVKTPSYTYVFFGWDNEYVCNPNDRVHVSFHVKTGFGHVRYLDKEISGETIYYALDDSSSSYYPVYGYSYGLVASNHFFSFEPGINVLCRLTDWLSAGAGFSSRLVYVMSEETPLRDEGFYAGSLFLRFQVPERRH